jgi:hypothetical protein
MIPGIILIACNPLAHEALGFSSWDPASYLRNLTVLVTLLYGAYLNLFRAPKKPRWIVTILSGVLGVSLSYLGLSGLVWLGAFSLLFSGMRMAILEQPLKNLPKDISAFFVGVLAATLLTPLSLIASLIAFLLVQVIYEMRLKEGAAFAPDRFQESYRTAERILKELSF